ncbi:MAG: hypothetical protein JO090_04080 [Rhizobacter sp.]|nr:hypothetical protein [Rhizobacter sp.]
MAAPGENRPRESRPGGLGSRGLRQLDDRAEYEDEDQELRKTHWRVGAWRQDSITRRHVTVYDGLSLLWLASLVYVARSGESYRPTRDGGSTYAIGAVLRVRCPAPLLLIAAIYFRLDDASLSATNRRGWCVCFLLLAILTYIGAPYAFGKVTFLH